MFVEQRGVEPLLLGSLAVQMVLRLQQLHSQGYLHRDIKPENILLNRPNENTNNDAIPIVYLIDYGLAK